MIRIKTLLNPVIIVPLLYIFQFLLYLAVFDRFKKDVYLLENVVTYLELESLLKYLLLFSFYYFGILFGSSVNFKFKKLDDIIFYKINVKFIYFLFLCILISEMLLIANFRNISIEELNTFAKLAYVSIQNEEAWYRTFINFSLFVGGFSFYYYLYGRKMKLIFIITSFILLINAIFLSQRQTFLLYILLLILIYIGTKGRVYKRIKLYKILLLALTFFIFLVLAEMFRFGMFNSFRKDIDLFSTENIIDVTKYLLTAYFAKDVNNALIALSSEPTYNLFSNGSKLIYKIILTFLDESQYTPIVDPGPYGTVNFLALLWIDWGIVSPFILLYIGLFVGFSYKTFLKERHFLSNFTFGLFFIGIFASLRVNYFFLNIFMYNIILILFSLLMYKFYIMLLKNTKKFVIDRKNKYDSD
jgi:oligosaccharide repeat unit polymerase